MATAEHQKMSRRQQHSETEERADSMSPLSGSFHQRIPEGSSPRRPSSHSSSHGGSMTPPNGRKTSSISAPRPQFVSFANTSELLMHLSKRVIEILNARDYANPFLSCLSSDLIGTNGSDANHGKAQVLNDFQRMVHQYPNYRAEMQNVTCSIDDDDRATVVMTTRISGFAFDTMRQTATLFTWTRSQDRWTCASWELVRRIEEFD